MEMLGAYVAKWRKNIMIGMVILESAFFTYPSGFVVSFIISAPYGIKLKVIEAS